jgi:hypothetical protein
VDEFNVSAEYRLDSDGRKDIESLMNTCSRIYFKSKEYFNHNTFEDCYNQFQGYYIDMSRAQMYVCT